MSKKLYILIRTLIALMGAFIVFKLYFDDSILEVGPSHTKFSCDSIGWNYKGDFYSLVPGGDVASSYDIDEYLQNGDYETVSDREAARQLDHGCDRVRQSRQTLITIVSVFSVGAFLAVPKPSSAMNMRKERRKQEREENKDFWEKESPGRKPRREGFMTREEVDRYFQNEAEQAMKNGRDEKEEPPSKEGRPGTTPS